MAQSFTTGDHSNGYVVSQVRIRMDNSTGLTTVVTIRGDVSGDPGNAFVTLTNPGTLANNALSTFTAPADTRLEANTTYWIAVNDDGGGTSTARFSLTDSNSETGTGWTIGDNRVLRNNTAEAWTTSDRSLMIEVRGYAAATPPTPTNQQVSNIGQSDTRTYRFTGGVVAQHFETGSAANGYELSSVELDVVSFRGRNFHVELWSAQPHFSSRFLKLGTRIATLRQPASLAANVDSFTAPSGTRLGRDRDYAVVFRVDDPDDRISLRGTNSSSRDSGGASGWSIGHGYRGRLSDWGLEKFNHGFDNRLKIKIRGGEAASAPTVPGGSTPPLSGAFWRATMKVGCSGTGWSWVHDSRGQCGVLSSHTVSYGGARHALQRLQIGSGSRPDLHIEFLAPVETVFHSGDFALYVLNPSGTQGTQVFQFDDATVSQNGRKFTWSNTDLDWSNDDGIWFALATNRAQTASQTEGEPLTAKFSNLPSSHGGEAFDFELAFNEAPDVSAETLKDDSLTVSGGSVTAVSALGEDGRRWSVTVTPSGDGEVTVSLALARSCDETGAVCTSDGRLLDVTPLVIVQGTPPTHVTGASVTSEPGDNGTWDTGETVTAEVVFSDTVNVVGPEGVGPVLALDIDGVRREAAYTGGTGTDTLAFSYTVTAEDDGAESAGVAANGLSLGDIILGDSAGREVAIGFDFTESDDGTESTGSAAALTAAFVNMPASHAGAAFTFELAFSETLEDSFSNRTLKGDEDEGVTSVLTVTNGTVTRASRIVKSGDERNRRFTIGIEPDGNGDVTVTLPASAACGETGAICTADGQALSAAVTATVPTATTTALTALFVDVPAHHDNEAFTFELAFSETLKSDFSNRTLKGDEDEGVTSVLSVTNGTVTRASRIVKSGTARNRRFTIGIEPDGGGEVTVTLPASVACGETGAICTADGRALTGPVTATVGGAPGLSVADAAVEEAAGATVDFAVTMSRAASGTVTVDYATSDGTATAGSDYTGTSGTLTFAAGETAKTVSVPVLDDALDEGSETFTLTLSNPSGGGAWLVDETATGTISNSDPLQRMWLARFGHTVGSQIVDEVSARLSRRLEGAQATVGGQTLDLLAGLDGGRALTGLARTFAEGGGVPVAGSSFHVAFGTEGAAPGLVAWGRVASLVSGMREAHRKGAVRLDNEVVTGILGLDTQWSRGIAGVALSFSDGRSRFEQQAVDSGTIEGSLTAVSPYGQLRLNDRLHVWSLAGFGTGEMTIRQDDRPGGPTRTDIGMQLGAAGVRGDLAQAGETGGLDLAVKADAFLVRMDSAKAPNTVATEAEASRLRVMLEGSRTFALGRGASLAPGLELGLRQDGGDAQGGAGVAVGAALAYAHAPSGLTARLNARTFVSRSDTDHEEWGVSGSLHMGGDNAGRGFLMSLAPVLGAASGSADRLWSAHDAGDLGADGAFEAEGRFDAEFGYGLPAFGVLTGTPYAGLGLSESGRAWRLGWRLAPGNAPLDFSFGVEATFAQPAAGAGAPSGHGLMLRGAIRW